MHINILCLVLLSAGILPINAQSRGQHILMGIVVDSVTGEPVPFANVYLNNYMTLGTSTDLAGRFILFIDDSVVMDSMAISCIGYLKEKIKLSNENNRSDFAIKLEPSVVQLKEVKIVNKALEPLDILKGALQLKEREFRSHNFKYTVLYSGKAELSNYNYSIDAVLDQYFFFRPEGLLVDMNILEERNNVEAINNSFDRVFFELGTWNFYEYDFVCNLSDPACQQALEITDKSLSSYNDKDILIIKYKINSTKSMQLHKYGGDVQSESGVLYIDPINNIILRHESEVLFETQHIKYYKNNLRRNFYNHKISFVRNYRVMNGVGHLSHYFLKRTDKFINIHKKIEEINSEHSLRLLNIDTTEIKLPDKVTPFVNILPTNEAFWKNLDSNGSEH